MLGSGFWKVGLVWYPRPMRKFVWGCGRPSPVVVYDRQIMFLQPVIETIKRLADKPFVIASQKWSSIHGLECGFNISPHIYLNLTYPTFSPVAYTEGPP